MHFVPGRGVLWVAVGLMAAVGLAGGSSGPGAAPATAREKPDNEPGAALRKFMREKLAANQKALEGLCVENYALIGDGADRLAAMSRAAEWEVIPGPEYAQLSGEFRRAVGQLRKGASDKNLEASRLAYLKLTMGCLDCHDFVRSTRLAALPERGLPRLPRPLSPVRPAG